MNRRQFLSGGLIVTGILLAGCNALDNSGSTQTSDPTPDGTNSSTRPAHWVSVYLSDRGVSRNASVTVRNENGTSLFEKEYQLSDSNEADEDAPFSASSEPETIEIAIDGTQFERDWPGFEAPKLPCENGNQAGIEIWIENDENNSPTIRIEASCQYVTMDG